ncbi:hypothetical protein [Paenibacillus sp. XY044]|uniref:hypothetical protein n=1 Tax=Paenibacillus sp. XY044 TaxID=2026089 RepID=UPI000B97F27A|nr:hypothetical protein [Paenibacillus sp. XY044]OZB96536.1 hypothetical protein CJP46_11700 [Paenibacillus sp. XY044]
MKKTLYSGFTMFLATLLLSTQLNAAPVESSDPQIDIPEGYELVKVYNNDSPLTGTKSLQQNLLPQIKALPEVVDNNTGKDIDVDVVDQSSRPLYDLKNIKTGEVVTEYVSDVGIMASSGTKTSDGYDKTVSVYAKATIYYIFSGSASEEGAALDKVDWRYEIKDSTVKIKSKSHLFIQEGPPLDGGGALKQRKTLTPTASYGTDLVRDWGWKPINSLVTYSLMGVQMDATLGTTYDSSSWTMQVKCMIIGIL